MYKKYICSENECQKCNIVLINRYGVPASYTQFQQLFSILQVICIFLPILSYFQKKTICFLLHSYLYLFSNEIFFYGYQYFRFRVNKERIDIMLLCFPPSLVNTRIEKNFPKSIINNINMRPAIIDCKTETTKLLKLYICENSYQLLVHHQLQYTWI